MNVETSILVAHSFFFFKCSVYLDHHFLFLRALVYTTPKSSLFPCSSLGFLLCLYFTLSFALHCFLIVDLHVVNVILINSCVVWGVQIITNYPMKMVLHRKKGTLNGEITTFNV